MAPVADGLNFALRRTSPCDVCPSQRRNAVVSPLTKAAVALEVRDLQDDLSAAGASSLRGWMSHHRTTSKGTSSRAPTPCKRSLQFSPAALPVTALASVQGSGNTWMRHLLQQLTGIYTGSIYDRRGDPELWAKGFYGEGVINGKVIAIKTHGLPTTRTTYHRAIVVIRNPFDAMFADFNRRASHSHTGVAPVTAYFEYWSTFSKEYADRWAKFHAAWLKFKGPLLVLSFDDLVHSLQSEVEKLADFLKHPSLAMDIRCALADSEGVAKRSRQFPIEKRDVFSKNLTRHINGKIGEVMQLVSPRFPELSQAIGGWRRNHTGEDLHWVKLPGNIS
ncbi:WSCD family member CG9164-like [Babylonia areolata]|uniref:WSCD family member CG9164-like n=1 Tax=Babylonia areolata TaxID=304850 RepID=UPI003FCF0407